MGTPDWQGRHPDVWRRLHTLDDGSPGFTELSRALWSDMHLAGAWLAAPDARFLEWRTGTDLADAATSAREAADQLLRYLASQPVVASAAASYALQKAGLDLSHPLRRGALRSDELQATRRAPIRRSGKADALIQVLTALRDSLKTSERVTSEGPLVIGALGYERPPKQRMDVAGVAKRALTFGTVLRLRYFHAGRSQPLPGEWARMPEGRTPAGILPIAIDITEAVFRATGLPLENSHGIEEFLRRLRADNPGLAFVGWPPP